MPEVGWKNPRRIDLEGKRFGKLTVVRKAGNRKSGESKWECTCDCGGKTVTTSSKLRKGHSTSCGCNVGEQHGKAGSAEYRSWNAIKSRCYRKTSKDYPDYGGRGIVVCDRWLDSFSAFLADMGPRPSSIHSIDREDTNGNYEPGNCRWATPTEQSNNKRNNVVIEYSGNRLTAHEWSKLTGINQEQIAKRIGRGWSPERALTQPMRRSPASAR